MDDFFDDMPRPTTYNKNFYKKWYFAYEKMWEAFKKEYGEEYIVYEGGNNVNEVMKEYEEKYLPNKP